MKAREGVMESEKFGPSLSKLFPVVEANLSDSGCCDNVLEFLVHAGERSLPEVGLLSVYSDVHFKHSLFFSCVCDVMLI